MGAEKLKLAVTTVVITLALALSGCGHSKPVAPTAFSVYTASDKDFQCDQPRGWTVSSFASSGTQSGVDFTSSDAKIDIDADTAGSYLGDIAAAGGSIGDGTIGSAAPSAVPPVEKLHAMQQSSMAHQFKGFSDQTTDHTSASYGDGRVTEFVADDIHGYRATLLGRERAVSVECQCAESDWPALKDGYLHVINSVRVGSGAN